jgi:hypothetical protein
VAEAKARPRVALLDDGRGVARGDDLVAREHDLVALAGEGVGLEDEAALAPPTVTAISSRAPSSRSRRR